MRWTVAFWLGAATVMTGADSNPIEFFEKRVQPVLAANCYSCHTASKLGGLRLDSRQAMLAGGKSGPAIVPGRSGESLLLQVVDHTHPRLKMPPQGKLSAAEIAGLRQWIDDGAHWPGATATTASKPDLKSHWSFQPIRKPAVPAVRNAAWPITPIDRFVLAKLESEGLAPVGSANRRVLIRRATFDLIGLPPAPADVEAFVNDSSPNAWPRVVERLLASHHYGERWGRHWLDVARYADEDVLGLSADPFVNAYRYRDWVVRSLDDDMPFDLFAKAQIAGDLLEPDDSSRLRPGLGIFALGPWYYKIVEPPRARSDERHDRVDVLTRGFLGLTVGCARCHDHKYDPVSTQDYYALAGVFANSDAREHPLAAKAEVERFAELEKRVTEQEEAIKEFLDEERTRLNHAFATRLADHLLAVRAPSTVDPEVVDRWSRYLKPGERSHSFLAGWDRSGSPESAQEFARLVASILEEKKTIEEYNRIVIEENKKSKDPYDIYCKGCNAETKALPRDRYVLWTDLFGPKQVTDDKQPGVLYFDDKQIDRWLAPDSQAKLRELRAELERRKKALPSKYPFLHVIADNAETADLPLHRRGDPYNLGEPVPRRFLSVLGGSTAGFHDGSGRKALAEAIASPANPLTARVIVNRVWKHHFGAGLVRTLSNFGLIGDRPSHPELLDYLAARLIDSGWSLKAIHREIMTSAVYQLLSANLARNAAADPENRLLWRANRRRLDAESLRDALLFVTGNLDAGAGGEPFEWDKPGPRRTLYGRVSRFRLERYLTLFDFPDPTITCEQRAVTNVPLQRLFYLNSELITGQAERFAALLRRQAEGDEARIRAAYPILFARQANAEDVAAGAAFLRAGGGTDRTLARYCQTLFGTNEFNFLD